MDLPPGFVTEAKLIAQEERRDLGLSATDPLDPWDLAELHGVEVIDIMSTPRTDALAYFTSSRPEAFSGAVLAAGNGAVIVENGSHAHTRRIATVTHELSHVLLEHLYHETLGGHDCTGTTGPLEQQADRLACELLVPRPAALAYARQDLSDAGVAARLGISESKARMCMNLSGARRQVARERAKRRHRG